MELRSDLIAALAAKGQRVPWLVLEAAGSYSAGAITLEPVKRMAFNYEKSGAAVLVGPLEAEVLDYLWERSGMVGVPDVHRGIAERRPISYSAVKAVLNNLHEKGWLRKDKRGKVTHFAALLSRPEFEALVLDRVLDSLKRNYGVPVIAHLVDQLAVDDETLSEFERVIADRRRSMPE